MRPEDSSLALNIEKTAARTCRNAQLEAVARSRHAGDARFAFLTGGAGAAYYEYCKQHYSSELAAAAGAAAAGGGGAAVEAGPAAVPAAGISAPEQEAIAVPQQEAATKGLPAGSERPRVASEAASASCSNPPAVRPPTGGAAQNSRTGGYGTGAYCAPTSCGGSSASASCINPPAVLSPTRGAAQNGRTGGYGTGAYCAPTSCGGSYGGAGYGCGDCSGCGGGSCGGDECGDSRTRVTRNSGCGAYRPIGDVSRVNKHLVEQLLVEREELRRGRQYEAADDVRDPTC